MHPDFPVFEPQLIVYCADMIMNGNVRLTDGSRNHWLSGMGFAVILMAGLAATLGSFRAAHRAERERVRLQFQGYATAVAAAVEQELLLYLRALTSMGPLYSLSDQISEQDFQEFAERGLSFSRDILGAYGFAQWIPGGYRTLLEQAEATDRLVIVELTDGQPTPAGRRSGYVPVMFQDPPESLGIPTGFDLASEARFAEAMERAFRSGAPVTAGLPPGLDRAPGGVGLFVIAPILSTQQQTPSLVLGLFRPERLLDRAIAGDVRRFMDIRITLPDLDDAGPDAPATRFTADNTVQFRSRLAFADRPLLLECIAHPAWVRASLGSRPAWILVSGFVITGLVLSVFHLLYRRTQRIEEVVAQRTRELQASKTALEQVMHERMRLETEILDIAAREQHRMGRDLHDSVGQKLSGGVYMTKALHRKLDRPDLPGDIRDTAKNLHETLKDCVSQVRRMAHGLSPIDLSPAGLADALRRLARETADAYGIDTEVEAADEVLPLDRKAATHLYQVAQEAVQNAMRHGQATRIDLRLREEADQGVLQIKDNGSGFDPAHNAGGMGLRIMRYRAEILGGCLEIDTDSGHGTSITLTFQVRES